MSTAIQSRRGTTTQHATFTGLVGEVTVDTDKNVAVVHDGITAGGHPLASETQVHSASAKTTLADADEVGLVDSAASNVVKKITWTNFAAAIWTKLGALIATGTGKSTPVDADTFALADSAASSATKSLTWANVKATIFAALGGLIAAATGKTTPVGADMVAIADSAASNATKMVTLTNFWNAIFTALGALIAAATGKTTPVGADMVVIADSAASNATKMVTLTNFWAAVFTGWGAQIAAAASKATPVDGDMIEFADSAASNATKKATLLQTWTNYFKVKTDAAYRAKGAGTLRVLAAFDPTDNEMFGTNAATINTVNNHPVLEFVDGVVALGLFTGKMDADYAGGGVTVDIDWINTTTSTLKACFGVYVENMDAGTTNFTGDSFGTETIDTTGVAANATIGIASRTSIAISSGNMDSVAAGSRFRLKIARETGQTNDTQAGTVQVLGVTVRET